MTRYHSTPTERAKVKIVTMANAHRESEKPDLLYVAGGNVKWYSDFGEQVGDFLKN